MTLEEEKRYLLLLGAYYCHILGASPTKRNVLDIIAERRWATFTSYDLSVKHNRNELVWRNDFAFVRKHLVMEGFFQGDVPNCWSMTLSGQSELKRLYGVCVSSSGFQKITYAAIQDGRTRFPFDG